MDQRLVVIGGGALGREVHQYALDYLADPGANPEFCDIAGFLDDLPETADKLRNLGVRFDFVDTVAGHSARQDYVYVIAIGNTRTRHTIAGHLGTSVRWANIIHPTAYVAPSARLGKGVVLAPYAFVGVGAEVGDHCVLNTYASCGHDSRIGADSVLSPYAVINGNVNLDDEVFLGTHATVIPGRKVGRRCSIAAGSVVTRDLAPGSLAVGNPATSRIMYSLDD